MFQPTTRTEAEGLEVFKLATLKAAIADGEKVQV
jgi:hypothetical protein